MLISRSMATPATPPRAFQPYVPASQSPAEFTLKADRHRRAVRPPVRRVHGVSGPARGPHRQRVDSDRRAGDLGAQTARRIDHPRKQHRPDDRIGRRIGGRRRRVHHSGAHLPDAGRPGVFQLLPDRDAGVCGRHPGRPDDGAAAPGAHRQGTRRAAVSGRHRVRRRPGGGRARRQARVDGVRRRWASVRCGRRCRGSLASS